MSENEDKKLPIVFCLRTSQTHESQKSWKGQQIRTFMSGMVCSLLHQHHENLASPISRAGKNQGGGDR